MEKFRRYLKNLNWYRNFKSMWSINKPKHLSITKNTINNSGIYRHDWTHLFYIEKTENVSKKYYIGVHVKGTCIFVDTNNDNEMILSQSAAGKTEIRIRHKSFLFVTLIIIIIIFDYYELWKAMITMKIAIKSIT